MNNSRDRAPAPGNNRPQRATYQKPKKKGGPPKRKAPVQPRPRASLVTAPAAVGSSSIIGRPRMSGGSNGDLVIEHEEYAFGVSSIDTGFTYNVSKINPGNAQLFPWLSGIAPRFESYVFDSLEFVFKSSVSSATNGTVMAAVDYDVTDKEPGSLSQLMQMESPLQTNIWIPAVFKANPRSLHKQKSFFVEAPYVQAQVSPQLIYSGVLYTAHDGSSIVGNFGHWYSRYRIRLMTPQTNNVGAGQAVGCRYIGNSNAAPLGTFTMVFDGQSTVIPAKGNTPFVGGATGTTASTISLELVYPWAGYISVAVDGTGILSQIATGSCAISAISQSFTATDLTTVYAVSGVAGQTFFPATNNTTITTFVMVLGQAAIPL